MKLCFGGSFNPIHHGHLVCARAVAEVIGAEKVILIPSSQPPHKPGASDIAPVDDRLAMCRLAASANSSLFEVDDLELKRSGPSYTLDTARELKRRGWSDIHWLIGADMLLYLPKWHQPEALLQEVNFVVMARPGWTMDWSTLPQPFQSLHSRVVSAPLIDISATDIRGRVRAGRDIQFLTPPAVVEYIGQRGLYR